MHAIRSATSSGFLVLISHPRRWQHIGDKQLEYEFQFAVTSVKAMDCSTKIALLKELQWSASGGSADAYCLAIMLNSNQGAC